MADISFSDLLKATELVHKSTIHYANLEAVFLCLMISSYFFSSYMSVGFRIAIPICLILAFFIVKYRRYKSEKQFKSFLSMLKRKTAVE